MNPTTTYVEPPLGLLPEHEHKAIAAETIAKLTKKANFRRVEAIAQAITRYADAGQPVPRQWITELRRRTK